MRPPEYRLSNFAPCLSAQYSTFTDRFPSFRLSRTCSCSDPAVMSQGASDGPVALNNKLYHCASGSSEISQHCYVANFLVRVAKTVLWFL